MFEFEWDEAKSERNQAKHGISFDEVKEALLSFDPLAILPNPNYPLQQVMVFRSLEGKICMAAIKVRKQKIRLISAHEDRKLRRKYGP